MINTFIGVGHLTQSFEQIPGTNRKQSYLEVQLATKTVTLPVTIDNHTTLSEDFGWLKRVAVEGSVRSYCEKEGDKNRNRIHCHLDKVRLAYSSEDDMSFVHMQGTCAIKTYSCEKAGKPNAQNVVKIDHGNRHYYIPTVAWSGAAKYLTAAAKDSFVDVNGTLISRQYIKPNENGEPITYTTYEVVVSRIIPITKGEI